MFGLVHAILIVASQSVVLCFFSEVCVCFVCLVVCLCVLYYSKYHSSSLTGRKRRRIFFAFFTSWMTVLYFAGAFYGTERTGWMNDARTDWPTDHRSFVWWRTNCTQIGIDHPYRPIRMFENQYLFDSIPDSVLFVSVLSLHPSQCLLCLVIATRTSY